MTLLKLGHLQLKNRRFGGHTKYTFKMELKPKLPKQLIDSSTAPQPYFNPCPHQPVPSLHQIFGSQAFFSHPYPSTKTHPPQELSLRPQLSLLSNSAPASSRNCMVSTWPYCAAQLRAVWPRGSGMSADMGEKV